MNKKIFSLLLSVVMICAVVPSMAFSASAQNPVLNICNGSVELQQSGTTYQYRQGAGAWTDYTGVLRLEGGNIGTGNTLAVLTGGHSVTVNGLSISGGGAVAPIRVSSGATLSMSVSGSNYLQGGTGAAAIEVPAGAVLNVDSADSGVMTATGGSGSCAVGAGGQGDGGAISINGGRLIAMGGSGGTGIKGGAVSVAGGTVVSSGISGSSSLVITGGSINGGALSAVPVNRATPSVQQLKLSTVDTGRYNVKVTDFSEMNLPQYYETKDMYTDAAGRLYLYLPEAAASEAAADVSLGTIEDAYNSYSSSIKSKYTSVDALKNALVDEVKAKLGEEVGENLAFYDVKTSAAGDRIMVKFPYPEGVNKESEVVIAHMKKSADIELPSVELTDDGIVTYVSETSPFLVAWKINVNAAGDDDAVSKKDTSKSNNAGNAKGKNTATKVRADYSPHTGDDSQMPLALTAMVISALLAALTYRRKNHSR